MRDWQLAIFDPNSAFGRSRVALATFKSEAEAKNFYKYCNTYFVRFLFLKTEDALTSLGKKVPDFGDYSNANAILDFTKDIDEQLYRLVGLDASEIAHVENTIKEVDKSRLDGNEE